ncbi:rhodanese-related sulfurtransferase [Priestia koreensis]|uniref:oxygen-dependent tRNA uridine(34) hydroxylase TrhO n=1 Tax=Priestia koreensis TaxID=284581 RepID=UPI001F58C792|nr:rhodanese-related sulfurtransferase [Priestia koreensis]MCM3004487.1 rhodanese-related sulfurtransferase [Priestia koreensis]UNL84695.1 rhodanese-related sulfurtransferase [Priestia koreensis]
MEYQVLLYYKYTPIEDPTLFKEEHMALCEEIGLKGRILVANEGINGTVSGTVAQTEAYMTALKADARFADMIFKIEKSDEHAFKKMKIKVKREIVNLSLEDDVNPNELTGNHLPPEEFYKAMQEDDVIIIDARNTYEYDLGHFKNAIRPDIETFRDLPDWIRDNLSDQKDKKVLTYCTGGIRCEKFSGFLLKEGFQDVSQLEGGIITYGYDENVQGRLWDGKCYVFDERISVPVNRTEESTIVGKCYYCGNPEERYVKCGNPDCNKHLLLCEDCEHEHIRSCSQECKDHPHNRYVKEHSEQVHS